MVACAVMTATAMVGIGASASDLTVNDNYVVSAVEQNDNGIMPYAISKDLPIDTTGAYQEDTNWCWVACTKVVLKYLGKTVSQEDIYKTAKETETVENKTGTFAEINKAIESYANKTFDTGTSPTYKTIADLVYKKNIVILQGYVGSATKAHDIVCYGCNYDDNAKTYTLKVFDPSKTAGGYGTITCSTKGSKTFSLKTDKREKAVTFDITDYMYGEK